MADDRCCCDSGGSEPLLLPTKLGARWCADAYDVTDNTSGLLLLLLSAGEGDGSGDAAEPLLLLTKLGAR
jgi:hypothetical protein